jgi:type IV secretion system protein TrbJ
MVETGFQQYENMLTHSLNIPNQLFGPIQNDLVQLAGVVNGGQAIAYSMGNLDGTFRQRFPGYGWSLTTMASSTKCGDRPR